MLGSHSHQFTLVAGALEVALALLVITSWTKLGAYLASVWLLVMAINLVMTGQYRDVALRDLGLCLGAFALAKLTAAAEVQVLHIIPTEIPRAA
jgi:hypothetical protein